jgi:site-specific DNA-cytosine methylase
MRAVELFSGGGGVAAVMRRLGMQTRHVELAPAACATLRAAGFRDVVEGDASATASWLPPWRIEHLHASPPCPKWSRANSRARHLAVDGWPWVMDALRALSPATFTAEITADAPVHHWAEDVGRLGFEVAAWKLDARDFGAPQTRTRWLIVASRLGMPRRPVPTHGDPMTGLRPYRTLGECLEPVGDRVVYPRGLGRAASEPGRLQRPAPTVTTTEVKGTRASASSGFTFHGGPDRASDAAFLATGLRRLTVSECARLQGFEEGWPFQGTVEAQYRQVGNAVPEALARVALESALATRR